MIAVKSPDWHFCVSVKYSINIKLLKWKNSLRVCRVVGGGVSEYLFGRGLCLPSGRQLSRDDQDRIIEMIRKCRK